MLSKRAAVAEPLNIVLLYADDWRHDTLSCAGHPVVRTPRLDQLAQEGVRYKNSYVTTSICGVSRASLLTGQWMSRHGNPDFKMFTTPWEQTYPGLLRAAGYFTGHIGKWHNGKFPAANYDFARSYSGTHWIKNPDGTSIHVTQKNENDALDFLTTRPKDRAFCLTVAFFATHAEDINPLQYLPQPESMSLYQDAVLPIPRTAGEAFFNKLPPFLANDKNEGRNRWHWRFDTPDKYQSYLKNYYRLCTEVDTACGRVLDELDRQGLRDKTLVIFTTDNGYFHGEHGLADKWYPYEESIRVPLIIRDPRAEPEAGSSRPEMVLNVDLAPTLLGAANITPPATMQGRDLAQLRVKKPAPPWRTEFYYEHSTIKNRDFIPSSQALVRDKEKYIMWPEFGYEELFDLARDPDETENLVSTQPERLPSLRTRFKELQALAK
ncbi:MAG: arylsulfatase family protein [Verrucomicrobiales bacterium]|nr:arylsulfatase family protein [Verrucomicrobiales bacterium]